MLASPCARTSQEGSLTLRVQNLPVDDARLEAGCPPNPMTTVVAWADGERPGRGATPDDRAAVDGAVDAPWVPAPAAGDNRGPPPDRLADTRP